ncbi:MAG: hypothetical protein ACSHWU_12070, partial [Marinicella sp.]
VTDLHSNVNVLNGRFIVELEQWAGQFDGTDYWLEISAAIPSGSGSFTTLSPRQKLGPVPYAEYAYDLDITGLQLRVDGTCDSNTAIQVIDQNGAVSCGAFAAEDHSHEFSELTSVPAGLADGDDDTTYNGGDFALSGQSCGAGQMVTGITAAGTIVCASAPTAALPPNCDQNNQALQYNTITGWACVDLTQIGGSAGQAQGFELTDSWGNTWDGIERSAVSWADANQSCESAGGRLPTITELYQVSGAFKSDVGSSYETNYIWSRTWWDKTNKTRVRLNDGAINNSLAINFSPYRCIWPDQTLNYFAGDQCMGEPGDACWDHVAYPNNTMSIDKMERPAVSYVAATDECAFVHAHLADQQDYAENAINGLPNGTNTFQWTSNHARYDIVSVVRWQDIDTNYNDYSTPYVTWANRSLGPYRFRCVGVNSPVGPYPNTVANEFIADTTYIKTSDAATTIATFGDSIDGCFSQGGHMAHSRDIMELARTGMTSGSAPDYIWMSDRSRYDITQIGRWTGTDTSYTGYYSEYVTWATVNLSNQNQHRCAYYPIDTAYTHPLDASCEAGVPCQTFENGASKLAVDTFDRPAATYLAATQDCLSVGGQLPTTLQLTEAIRAGLPNGFDLSLWTTDGSGNDSNAYSYATVLNWIGTDPSFSPIYSANANWSTKLTTTNNYRCVWSNEMR